MGNDKIIGVLNQQQALKSLCYYDKRNPDYDEENGPKKENCACDNCFYGRTPLAETIIQFIDLAIKNINL